MTAIGNTIGSEYEGALAKSLIGWASLFSLHRIGHSVRPQFAGRVAGSGRAITRVTADLLTFVALASGRSLRLALARRMVTLLPAKRWGGGKNRVALCRVGQARAAQPFFHSKIFSAGRAV